MLGILLYTLASPAPATPLHVGSSAAGAAVAQWTPVTETSATRSAADGEFILVNVASCVVTLPSASSGAHVAVKTINATVTSISIKTHTSGVLIDGVDRSSTGLSLTSQYEQVNLISDGTNWFVY